MTYEISVIELIELSSYVERDFAFCAVCESLFASISVRSGFFEDQNGFLFEKGISILFSKGPGTLAKEKGVVKQKQKPLSTGRLLGDTQQASIPPSRQPLESKNIGMGVGLSITRQLCEMMDGTIQAESTYGEGSIFTVRLPQGQVVK